MLAAKVGRSGETAGQLKSLKRSLRSARRDVLGTGETGRPGFLGIPERRAEMRECMVLAEEVAARFRTLIVIGIGGSDLGARALISALGRDDRGMEVRFIGANTDPEEITGLLRSVDLKRCALNIVSKSGGTIEPMSTFLLLRDRLIRKVGRRNHARHVIATTDREKGLLRSIAGREGYRTLPVPEGIGGRFSALTPVGLFPAACAGIRVTQLITGARKVRDSFVKKPSGGAPALFAGLQYHAFVRRKQNITVLMPYADSLRELGQWFRQLWAESLGKRTDRRGRTVRVGQTPVAALGATDQHSQIQLYNEGPLDKTVTFIEVERFREDLVVPSTLTDLDGLSYMSGHRFSEIIHAERAATAHALKRQGRPNGTIFIPEISGQTVGGLMMFFMAATAVAGELLDIDAYDQPGVEAGKRAMYGILGRKGYSRPGR